MTDIEFTEDLAQVAISFFVGKPPVEGLDVEMLSISIDGVPVHVWQSGPLPGSQGTWFALGVFEAGRSFDLHYEFRTGFRVPQGNDIVLGYYPDGKLTEAVRFAHLRVEPNTRYSGDTRVTVVKP